MGTLLENNNSKTKVHSGYTALTTQSLADMPAAHHKKIETSCFQDESKLKHHENQMDSRYLKILTMKTKWIVSQNSIILESRWIEHETDGLNLQPQHDMLNMPLLTAEKHFMQCL